MIGITRIALVGLPGSGKTTIAPLLAARLGWTAVDLDEEITAALGRTPAAILAADGERAFRKIEFETIDAVIRRPEPIVIACGGGLVTEPFARGLLSQQCCVVWLDAPDVVLIQRVGDAADRPLLGGSAVTGIPRLRASRVGAHEAVAHLHVPSDDPPESVAARIAAALEGGVPVSVDHGTYHVEVRPGALADVVLHVPAGASRVAVVADRSVPKATDRLVASLRSTGIATTVLAVSGGEHVKTWASAGRMLTRLGAAGLQRNDCVVALGGGTVGDLAGFAAATYLRGIAWLNVPTTLLAMVDSAIGGKTGVNLARGKNLAGAFWPPRAVICDPDLLSTQDDRSYRAAFAEVVKYSMITDRRQTAALDATLDMKTDDLLTRDAVALTETVRTCAAFKAEVVTVDERDTGGRAVLNYGHTVGHALEAAAGFGNALLHGEAVAVGMRAAGRLSIRHLGCPAEDIAWQDEMIGRFGLGAAVDFDPDLVLDHMGADKKTVGDRLGWVLLEAKGSARCGQHVPEPAVRAALDSVLAR